MSNEITSTLFEKSTSSFADVQSFVERMTVHNFKRSIDKHHGLFEKNYVSKDTLICYAGKNPTSDLISVWSRIGSKRKRADYGVRIHEVLVKKLIKKSSALEILLAQYTDSNNYEDSDEYRVSFNSLADVELFLNLLFDYVAVANEKQSTKELNESETKAV